MYSFIPTTPLLTSLLAILPKLASASLPPIAGTGYNNVLFQDDFQGTAGNPPNPNKWLIDTGTQYPNGPSQWGTGEIETYTNSPNNVALSGKGQLRITPVRADDGSWTSGRIETQSSNFVPPAGGKMKVEASIRQPNITPQNGLGYWPAFWMLGSNYRNPKYQWPDVGEMDIMENVNALPSSSYSLHCGTNPGGPCNEPNGIGKTAACPSTNCNGNYHTYTLVIDRTNANSESLNYYTDNQLMNTIHQSDIPAPYWADAVHEGHFVLLNVAMGGAYPNGVAQKNTPTNETISGRPMIVDYVLVWTT